MIHHLARAFFVRNLPRSTPAPGPTEAPRPASAPAPRPVKARPITPWTAPQPTESQSAQVIPLHAGRRPALTAVRISVDPSDARRTVITGRFAEVCAALERLVREQEAAA